MAFHVHRSERADRLVEALAELLARPLDDPMVAEVVAVPTRGVERWVSQRLATFLGASAGGRDGVCANVEFPFPGRLVAEAVDAGTPEHAGSEVWRPERMVWPLVEVLGAHIGQAWLAPLAGLVGGEEATTDRRFGAVRHVADLFDRYSVHRPGMLRAWAAGDDVGGDGAPLPPDATWQAELWRRLRARLAVPSGAERLVAACPHLAEDPGLVDLPPRLVLFGLTRIPASHVEVLRALACGRDIHLFALHPSPELWDRIEAATGPGGRTPRHADPTAELPRHPLLAGWGRDAREMQLVLASGLPDDAVDRHYPVPATGDTLLRRIQADIRADRLPPGRPAAGQPDRRAVLDASDRSIQVHDCHGRARQVEVLRDAVLHLLRDDPTLEPRDIVVMCPDIDAFAPLIHATFGTGTTESITEAGGEETTGRGPGDLRVRLADRSLRQTNPVLGVVSELLDLAEARLTASQVLDLAGRAPVRARFGFDDDDIDRLEQWVAAAGIRWGLDGAHRGPYGLAGLEANTWKAGLDRLLLGAAMSEDGHPLVGGVLPLDDVGSGDLELVGRLTELVTRLGTALDGMAGPQSLAGWVGALALASWSLTATSDADDWQRRELDQLLDDLLAEAGDQAEGPQLTLAELRALVADRLRGHPTRANFRTGHLTICTLVPMRSVPHRVVCLLGLDDGAFPRPSPSDGDDLIERAPFVGDRDGRSEDRQLLLDALLAATDNLVITYSGRDERTNARRPPAVPLGELLDTADRTARTAGEDGLARHAIRIVHPLQPFDPRNFTAGGLGRPGTSPWSFDPLYLAGAEAMQAARGPLLPFLGGSLTPLPPRAIELDALVRFLRHPVREFLRQRLGVVLTDRSTEPDDALSVELDALQRWKVGDRLLQARLGGADPAAIRAAEMARGELPPGELGELAMTRVAPVVDHLVEVAATHPVPAGAETARSVDVAVALGEGFSVVGTVTGIIGSSARSVAFSRVRPDLRLAAWARLLVLVATGPEVPWTAVTIGQSGGKVVVATAGPLPGEPAARRRLALVHLGLLVDLYQRGMAAPLPIYTATSAAYAEAAFGRKDPVAAARASWATTKEDWTNEDRDVHHQLVLGRVAELDELLEDKPWPDESGPGWPEGEDHRLGRYALRLWSGLLQHERMATP